MSFGIDPCPRLSWSFFSKQKMTSRSEKKEPNQQLHDMLFIWSEYKESCNGSKEHDKK